MHNSSVLLTEPGTIVSIVLVHHKETTIHTRQRNDTGNQLCRRLQTNTACVKLLLHISTGRKLPSCTFIRNDNV